jgi:glutathione S-transferase
VNLKLVIANKNYSSWSMRPWVLLRQAGIPFEEIQLEFEQDNRVVGVEAYSPTRQVPVLLIDGGPVPRQVASPSRHLSSPASNGAAAGTGTASVSGVTSPEGVPVPPFDGAPVWDSLAIAETVAEMFPEKGLWPAEARTRAVARSACAEMHAGFRALRSAMPMNIRASHPGKGLSKESRRDIARVLEIWRDCRERFGEGGPLLFGRFTVADAYYAPVVMRFVTYSVSLPDSARAYVDAVCDLAAVTEWISAARRETGFVAADEPYATKA